MTQNKRMFETNRLTITGSEKQISQYASDKTEYDYVKSTLEKIVGNAKKNMKEDDTCFRLGRLNNGNHLVIMKQPKKPVVLMTYNAKTEEYSSEINVDDLNVLKKERNREMLMWQTEQEIPNLVSDKSVETAFNKYKETLQSKPKFAPDAIKCKSVPQETVSLKSEKGFYVGDPRLALRDDILKNGIQRNGKIVSGLYQVKDKQMLITNATKGDHDGYQIYSGAIGVIPLELVDTKKLNRFKTTEDSMYNIKRGEQLNVISKKGNLFLAQNEIETIDTVNTKPKLKQIDDELSL